MAENSADIAKRIILKSVAEGLTVDSACKAAGKSIKTYEYYRRTDRAFADKMDRTRLGLREKNFASTDVTELTFEQFRERFLHSKTFPHQKNLPEPKLPHPDRLPDAAPCGRFSLRHQATPDSPNV